MVQNNQKTVFYAVYGHFDTPKWTQNDTQGPTIGQDVWSDV